MRRRGMRGVSIALTALLVLSSPGMHLTAFAAEGDADVQNVHAAESSQEELVVTEKEDDSNNGKSQVNESNTDTLEEEKLNLKLAASDSALVSSVITDSTLMDAVLGAYKSNSQGDSSKTESTLTYADLRAITGTLDLSSYTNVTVITADAFAGCKFSGVKLPSSLVEIDERAFAACPNLLKIDLPDTLTTLKESAFFDCANLASINTVKGGTTTANTLPSGLVTVGNKVFASDVSLTEITIQANKDTAFQYADSLFSGCKGLTKITIKDGVSVIPQSAFDYAGTAEANEGVEVTFGKDVTQLLANAFKGIKLKENSTLDFSGCAKLAGIGSGAFEAAVNVTEVILPKTTSASGVELGDRAFALTKLTEMDVKDGTNTGVYLPDYISAVGKGCFYGNEVMTAVSLSPNITVLSDNLFDGCTALAEVTQRQSGSNCKVTAIGDCAFRGTAITNTSFLMNMNQLKTIGYQQISEDNYKMKSGVWDGINANSRQNQEISIGSLPLGGEGDKVVIDGTTKQKTYDGKQVGSEVFTGCYNLTSVEIPSSVVTIGSRAFYFYQKDSKDTRKPEVTSISWASGTTKAARTVWTGAFQGNEALTSVTLPYCSGDTMEIMGYAFSGNVSLTKIGKDTSGSNVLPSSITKLGKGVFFRCKALPKIVVQDMENKSAAPELGELLFEQCTSLTSATLPASITTIPRHCFYNAPLATFYVGEGNTGSVAGITEIGTLAFFGNQFTEVDLSDYTGLREIGAGAYASYDIVKEDTYEGKYAKYASASNAGKLEKVILPNKLVLSGEESKATLYMNTAVFYGQKLFDTMTTPNARVDGAVVTDMLYIPDYLVATGSTDGSRALFGATGVSKAVWQADLDSNADQTNVWTDIPAMLYANCWNITSTADVLPTGDYVKTIGKGAFYGSSVETADLSGYTQLKEIGSLKVDSEEYNGVFGECLLLTTVTLPQSTAEKFVLGEKTFYKGTPKDKVGQDGYSPIPDSLTKVDLGTITEMGQYAFTNSLSLTEIVFPDSLKTIANNAFEGCSSLTTVDFGALQEMGEKAFINCVSLTLTKDAGLPDSLVTIGSSAFENAGNTSEGPVLGLAKFGSQLKIIGQKAFYKSGLQNVDFTKASSLTNIQQNAFYGTALTKFILQGTQVSTIMTGTLTGCMQLTDVELGDEVAYISANSINGCPAFKNFTFAATTTVNENAFKNAFRYDNVDYYTAANNNYTLLISVSVPEETVLPLDRTGINLPYYIDEEDSSTNFSLKHILINREKNDVTDSTVKEHLKVHAKLNDGYFWGKAEQSGQYAITDDVYYEALEQSETAKVNQGKTTVNVIKLDTLKAGSFDLTVAAEMKFNLANGNYISSGFSTDYKITVKEMKFDPALYQEKTTDETGATVYNNPVAAGSTTALQGATNMNKGSIQLFYQMKAEQDMQEAIDTYSIVVKTDNPAVLFPCSTNNMNGTYSEEGYVTSADRINSSTNVLTPIENNMKFWLVAKSVGTAHITVYPKGHENWARTYTFVVNADLDSIQLAVPDAYKNGTAVGNTFNIFAGYSNIYGQVVNAENMDQAAVLSNRGIVYTSNAPDYVSVDNNGTVTVLKADTRIKTVRITASAQNTPGGKTVIAYADIKINAVAGSSESTGGDTPGGDTPGGNTSGGTTTGGNTPNTPAVKVNQKVEDAASQTSVVVTKVAENGAGGEVKITQCNNAAATTIVIPDSVDINGVQYKVTTISANAFANNKKVKTIQIGKNVITIESAAFSGCTALTKVIIPASVTKIGFNAFLGCKKLKTVTIPANSALTEIGAGAFQNCKALTKITIPKKVTTIGNNAFYNCSKLKNITIKSTVLSSVGSNAFKGIHKKAVIKVPKKKLSAYKTLLKGKGQKSSVKIKK